SSQQTDEGKHKVSLQGEWSIYRAQLLLPEQILLTSQSAEYVKVPGPMNQQKVDRNAAAYPTFGTYHLHLTLSSAEIGQSKALYISDIASAYMVWVNGKRLGGIGVVGSTAAEEVPQSRLKLLFFEPEHTEI